MSKKLISIAYCEGAKDAVNSIAKDVKNGIDVQDAILKVRETILSICIAEQNGVHHEFSAAEKN